MKSYGCSENLTNTRPNLEFTGLEDANSTGKFNHNYMEILGYKTCDKLLQTSGIVDREIKILSSKVKIPSHVKHLNPASPIGFANFPDEDTCDINSDNLIKN